MPCHSSLVFSSGIELFGTGLGDAYYASNDMDPYLKNNVVCDFISWLCFANHKKPINRMAVVFRMMMMRMMKRSRTSP